MGSLPTSANSTSTDTSEPLFLWACQAGLAVILPGTLALWWFIIFFDSRERSILSPFNICLALMNICLVGLFLVETTCTFCRYGSQMDALFTNAFFASYICYTYIRTLPILSERYPNLCNYPYVAITLVSILHFVPACIQSLSDFELVGDNVRHFGLQISTAINSMDISLDVFFLYIFLSHLRLHRRVDTNDRHLSIVCFFGIIGNVCSISNVAVLVQFFIYYSEEWWVAVLGCHTATFVALAAMKVTLYLEYSRRKKSNALRVLRAKTVITAAPGSALGASSQLCSA
ncbi:hypothetical protein HDU84_003149 [Entophlyctis sp. JEL0112]|nr:hypothetical protein HDU84_003149 [Entophlyctis sp. JEL0112]